MASPSPRLPSFDVPQLHTSVSLSLSLEKVRRSVCEWPKQTCRISLVPWERRERAEGEREGEEIGACVCESNPHTYSRCRADVAGRGGREGEGEAREGEERETKVAEVEAEEEEDDVSTMTADCLGPAATLKIERGRKEERS